MTAAIATEENRRVALAIVALAFGAVAMGASVLFVRWADVGPYASAFWRVTLALPLLFAWMRLAHVPEKWAPVFRQGHAPLNKIRACSDSAGTDML